MKLPGMLRSSLGLLRLASVAILISLALMAWGILHPRPLPVIVAMSIGQGIGMLGAAMFLFVVVRDLRRSLRSPGDPPSAAAPTTPGGAAPTTPGGAAPAPPAGPAGEAPPPA